LVSCGLTMLLAVLIASLLVSYDWTFGHVARQRLEVPAEQWEPPTAEQKFLVRILGGLWVAVLVVVFVGLALALVDMWATRRFGLRQYRKIREERRAMIQGEVNRLRGQRNGQA